MLRRSFHNMSRFYGFSQWAIKYSPGKHVTVSVSATCSDGSAEIEHKVLSKHNQEKLVLRIKAKSAGMGTMAIKEKKFSIEVPTPHEINSVKVMHEGKSVYFKEMQSKKTNRSDFFRQKTEEKIQSQSEHHQLNL
jgi:hypothetical protein